MPVRAIIANNGPESPTHHQRRYMKKILPLAVLAAAVALSACSKKDDVTVSAKADGPLVVRVGHAAPLTGPQAHLGD